jgi:hypothetical protein
MSSLFLSDARVEIFLSHVAPAPIGHLEGAQAIGHAVAGMMPSHPPRGWSHHTTHDPIIEVVGDTATIDVQFIVFNTVGSERPQGGWPEGAAGAQGTVRPVEAGYYRSTLKRIDGVWKFAAHQIFHDLPFAFPGA